MGNIIVKSENGMIGHQFGKLIVIKQADDYIRPSGGHTKRWLCHCECGNYKIVTTTNLKNGKTKSCGCIRKNNMLKMNADKHKTNKYKLFDKYGVGYSTNTNEEFYFDIEDYEKIKKVCWFVHNNKSGLKKIEGRDCNINKTVSMHEFLGFKYCDHIDRNELNNRKDNLRICSQAENTRNRSLHKNNTSGIIGVSWHSSKKLWRAYIMIDGKTKYIGEFKDKNLAIISRLKAEKYYFKEFAPQRNLFKQYNIN